MVLLALMATLGAISGARIRPWFIAVPAAAAIAGGGRNLVGLAASAAVENANAAWWAKLCLALIQSGDAGYPMTIGAAWGAAAVAAMLAHLARKRDAAAPVSRRVRKGRYVRAPDMIEARPRQALAESRQKSVLGL